MKNRISSILFYILVVVTFITCTKPSATSSSGEQIEKEIISFLFRLTDNPSLNSEIGGVIQNDSIFIDVPFGTDVSDLIPTITILGADISPSSNLKQDFNEPVYYTVSAKDRSIKRYTVMVKVGEAGGTLYINSTYPNPPWLGKLYAIDANNGALKWEYTLSVNADESSPTFYNGMIYMAMG